MNKKLFSLTGIGILICIFVIINVVSFVAFRRIRIDLTEESLYSLSDGTKNVLSSLDDTITLKLYFSKTETASVPFIATYASRIQN